MCKKYSGLSKVKQLEDYHVIHKNYILDLSILKLKKAEFHLDKQLREDF